MIHDAIKRRSNIRSKDPAGKPEGFHLNKAIMLLNHKKTRFTFNPS